MPNLRPNCSTLPFTLHNDDYVELYIIIGSMPCSIGCITDLMVISQPLYDSRHRRIRMKKLLPSDYVWVQQIPIRLSGFYTNPISGSLLHPNSLTKKPLWIIGHLISHNVVGCLGQFVTQCLDSNCPIGLCHLALIETLGMGVRPDGKVSCLYICPG